MSQKVKATRSLQFPGGKTIDANYNLTLADSGNIMVVNSLTGALIAAFLPRVESNAGLSYQFMTANTGEINLVAPTNTILSTVSVNTDHRVKSLGSGINIGVVISALCDGTNWNVWANQTAANVRAFTER